MKRSNIKIVIIGGGFAGLNAAMNLGNKKNIDVTLIDRKNHHLFQPLLYQVATAGLSAEEIASPIRSVVSRFKNIQVILGNVVDIKSHKKIVLTEDNQYEFDFLILACGATHNYFGHDEWKNFAPGMKTIEHALEIRRKILLTFELAEKETDAKKIAKLLTFIIVGGGPTGVELAGSIAEMGRYTLKRDFRNIDVKKTSIILIEAGPRILASFSLKQSEVAQRDLEKIGVTVLRNSKVTKITSDGISLQEKFIFAATVIWAAGVQPSPTGKMLASEVDSLGRVKVTNELHLKNNNYIFVLGDQAFLLGKNNLPLPGLASVALQQGVHAAKNILRHRDQKSMLPFVYFDKGQMATIGRGYAVVEIANFKLHGLIAWLAWLLIHILYLIGFRNKLLVLIRWAWLYCTYSSGARIITDSNQENK